MARVTTVAKAQKDQGRCEKCGTDLPAGSSYKWIKPRSHRGAKGYKRKRCVACPNWRPSETTSSPALGILHAAQEAASDALDARSGEDGLDAAQTILTDLAEGVREAAAQYEESASNMEDGFGGETSISAEIREKGETLDPQADDIENSDLPDDFDEDAAKTQVVEEAGVEDLDPETYDWDEDPEDLTAAFEQAREEWADEVRDAIQSALDLAEAP